MNQEHQVPLGPRALARTAACFSSWMLSVSCALPVLTFLTLVAGPVQRAQADKIYFVGLVWAIGRANLDGTDLQRPELTSLVTGGLALGPAGGRTYWAEGGRIYTKN